jgi:hypothetical protein
MSFSASKYDMRTDTVRRRDGEIQVVLTVWRAERYLELDFARAMYRLLGLAISKAELENKWNQLAPAPDGAVCSTCGSLVTTGNRCPNPECPAPVARRRRQP